jgi:hypothetical protein
MAPLEAAKGATAQCGDALRKVEQLPGPLDIQAIKSHLQVQHLVSRLGLTPTRAALIASLAWESRP